MASSGITTGITIICVFNDLKVREACLDRSIEMFSSSNPVEYIPLNNVDGRFSTAGAALNFGARAASHDVVVLVHQDVFLHSLGRLESAAQHLRTGEWGVLGAVGVAFDGTVVGRMRDRVVLIGSNSPDPVEVDSLDEVLFMASRDVFVEHPLSESEELAWHAYGVEYCVRVRARGTKAGALNLDITHNSLTINLSKLDVAHRAVAELYPDRLPVRTTCGVVGDRRVRRRLPAALTPHAWRYRWLRESLLAWQIRRRLPGAQVVLSDIRLDVDMVTEHTGKLRVINVDDLGGFASGAERVDLPRCGRLVSLGVASASDLAEELRDLGDLGSILITNVSLADLQSLRGPVDSHSSIVIGVHEHDVWILITPAATELPAEWRAARCTPFAMSSRRRVWTAARPAMMPAKGV